MIDNKLQNNGRLYNFQNIIIFTLVLNKKTMKIINPMISLFIQHIYNLVIFQLFVFIEINVLSAFIF